MVSEEVLNYTFGMIFQSSRVFLLAEIDNSELSGGASIFLTSFLYMYTDSEVGKWVQFGSVSMYWVVLEGANLLMSGKWGQVTILMFILMLCAVRSVLCINVIPTSLSRNLTVYSCLTSCIIMMECQVPLAYPYILFQNVCVCVCFSASPAPTVGPMALIFCMSIIPVNSYCCCIILNRQQINSCNSKHTVTARRVDIYMKDVLEI